MDGIISGGAAMAVPVKNDVRPPRIAGRSRVRDGSYPFRDHRTVAAVWAAEAVA